MSTEIALEDPPVVDEAEASKPPLGPFRTTVRILGILSILGGLVVVGYIGYQHWGTAQETKAAQTELSTEFEARRVAFAEGREYVAPETVEDVELTERDTADDPMFVATAAPTTTAPLPSTPVTAASIPSGDPVPGPAPELTAEEAPPKGVAVARIEIPAIELDWTVVEGDSLVHLREGPIHLSGTPLPGQLGNAVISGHRTTWGAPFHDLDLLEPGDVISVETLIGTHTYEVVETIIVSPYDGWVLGNTESAVLTLTTCHPKSSSRQRLVVRAVLVSGPNLEIADAVFPNLVLPAP